MLLEEIRDGAVDSNTDITTVLRKCLVLAVKLGHDGFRQWVEQELNGYKDAAELPPYRVLHVDSLGTFLGGLGRQLSNVPVPVSNIPDEFRHMVATLPLIDPIAALVSLTKGNQDLQAPWSADLTALVADKFYVHMNLVQAWRVVPRNSIVGIVDTVRNRLLSFVLEIEKQYPEAGEKAAPAEAQPSSERVGQIFNTLIMGGTNPVAIGSSGFSQIGHQVVVAGDIASLRAHLVQLGVEKQDLDELETALSKDTPPKGGRFGTKVADWIGKMTGKAASGGWDVATGAGADLLATAIRAYYGM